MLMLFLSLAIILIAHKSKMNHNLMTCTKIYDYFRLFNKHIDIVV